MALFFLGKAVRACRPLLRRAVPPAARTRSPHVAILSRMKAVYAAGLIGRVVVALAHQDRPDPRFH